MNDPDEQNLTVEEKILSAQLQTEDHIDYMEEVLFSESPDIHWKTQFKH